MTGFGRELLAIIKVSAPRQPKLQRTTQARKKGIPDRLDDLSMRDAGFTTEQRQWVNVGPTNNFVTRTGF